MTTATEHPVVGVSLEERMTLAMWRAKLTPPKMARLIGVSPQTVRTWLDPEHASTPRHSDVLAWAAITGAAIAWLDPEHPHANTRVVLEVLPDPSDPLTQNLKMLKPRRNRSSTRPRDTRPRAGGPDRAAA